MAFSLDDYNTVPERITEAKALYPEGRFTSEILPLPDAFAGSFVAVKARFYRTADDLTPAEGLAWEPVPGKTPYTRDSELMNAETSAWGRALVAAFAADTKKGVASREEVAKRREEPAEVRPIHVAKARLLAAVEGDKDKARELWATAAQTFGYEPDAVPDDQSQAVLTAALAGGGVMELLMHEPEKGDIHSPTAYCPGGRPATLEDLDTVLTHVGLLIGDDEFIPKAIVEQHLPFAAPSGVQIRGVYVIPRLHDFERVF